METFSLEQSGIINAKAIYRNLSSACLTEAALARGEGILSDTGALVVRTGTFTGRSPKDKFIVDTPGVHDEIAWGSVNRPITRAAFKALRSKAVSSLQNRELFVFDGFAGADPVHRKKFRIINELASENLFIHNLLIRPTAAELDQYGEPDFTIIAAPGFHCNPESDGVHSEAAILIDYEAHEILIVGTRYAGEIKKSVFSVMNYLMPKEGVLPKHCSANMDPVTKETAIFFGLSGTGKTTLSADPERLLIGDDEHGWSPDGVFNFEGGCYAKCINLDPEREPEVYDVIKAGTLVENVILDAQTRKPDYTDKTLTENTRAGYPITYIANAEMSGLGGTPSVVIFLTADSFGVLPPISRLSKEAAMYHFVTGFTSKVAGTEQNITEPVPTFSTLFGEPFMPLHPQIYAHMLGERIVAHNTTVYLVNTGWTGGPYGTGSRIALKYTRAMITAALNGSLKESVYVHNDRFNVDIPQTCPNVPEKLLNPRATWADPAAYDAMAAKVAKLFYENFHTKYPRIREDILNAGPRP